METFVDIISDIGAQISKIKRCRVNQQTLNRYSVFFIFHAFLSSENKICHDNHKLKRVHPLFPAVKRGLVE